METDPVSETLCFIVSRIPDDRQSENSVILCVMYHHQTPSESTCLYEYFPRVFSGKRNRACYLLHSGFLLGISLDFEDGRDTSVRNVGWLKRTTRCYISEDTTLHNHHCGHLKSYISHYSVIFVHVNVETDVKSYLPRITRTNNQL
jgi:hypothetical protein